jgi:hypothetical protein
LYTRAGDAPAGRFIFIVDNMLARRTRDSVVTLRSLEQTLLDEPMLLGEPMFRVTKVKGQNKFRGFGARGWSKGKARFGAVG